MRPPAAARLLLALALLGAPLASHAGKVELVDEAALRARLARSGPCCVIDARSAASQAQAPVEGAIPYRRDLRINPTSAVVVIADSDARALEIGRAVGAASDAREVYAVTGGVQAWQAASRPAAGAPSGPPLTFVIPRNTCEQGVPLETRRIDRQ